MDYFLYVLSGSLCCYFYCINLLPRKIPMSKKCVTFLYILIATYYFNVILGQMSTFFTLTGALILIFIFTKHDLLSVSCCLFGYLYSVTANYIFLWITGHVLRIPIEELLTSILFTNIFSYIYCVFCGITTMLIGRLLHRKLKIADLLKDSRLLTAIFLDLMLLSAFFIFNISYGDKLGYSYGVVAYNCITFLLLFIITVCLMYFVYQKVLQEEHIKVQFHQFHNLQEYTQKLEEAYGTMREFKHDYINILSTMSEFIKDNDMPELNRYFQMKVMPISHHFTESDTKLGSLSYITDKALKGFLSSKLIYSMELGIHTKIELTETIEETYMDYLGLSRILGVFLDNAIEAALDSEEKIIRFCMFYKETHLIILVQNSSPPLLHQVAQLNSMGISSKGESRGLGLYHVEHILKDRADIIWSTDYNAPYFIQKLIFIK